MLPSLMSGLFLLGILASYPASFGATNWEPYFPPEVAFADHLRQKVTVPAQININQGSLSQLETLPGFTEDIALKVLRSRPFADIQDFYRRLPGLDKKSLNRLIEQIQPKAIFK